MLKCADYLYIIRCGTTGAIKVGRSNDPEVRLAQLQTGCPTALRIQWKVAGAGFLERLFHELFADERIRGEWYAKDSRADRTISHWNLGPYRETAPLLATFAAAVDAATEGDGLRWADSTKWTKVPPDLFRFYHDWATSRSTDWAVRALTIEGFFEDVYGRKLRDPDPTQGEEVANG